MGSTPHMATSETGGGGSGGGGDGGVTTNEGRGTQGDDDDASSPALEGRGVGVMWVKAMTNVAKVFLNKTNRKAMDLFRDLAIRMNREELSGLTYGEVLGGLTKDTQ